MDEEVNDFEIVRNLYEQSSFFRSNYEQLEKKPPVFKKIDSKKIKLSKSQIPKEDFSQVLKKRRTNRQFGGRITIEELSQLLEYSAGFHELFEGEGVIRQKKIVPSAGGFHPNEMYVICQDIEQLHDGVYHYDAENHQLEVISKKKVPQWQIKKILPNNEYTLANVIFVMAAKFKRTTARYGPRAFRHMLLDAGHIGQNLNLVACALKLSVSSIGMWDDSIISKLLKINPKEELITYLIIVGRSKS